MTSDSASIEEELLAIESEVKDIDAAIQKLNNTEIELVGRTQVLKDKLLLQKTQSFTEKDWDEESFPWSKNLASTLQQTFKISNFRPLQLSAINAIMAKKDVILTMPAGGGKSLCYQLPAVISEGMAVVVGSQIKSMEREIKELRKLRVIGNLIHHRKRMKKILSGLVRKKETPLKLLYVKCGRMAQGNWFKPIIQQMFSMKQISLIAIDDVHRCSQWGHDFRPVYQLLGEFKSMFPGVPILGLTTAATSKVIVDVQKMLNIQGCLVLKATVNRPNLYYEVRMRPSNQVDCISQLEDLLNQKYANQGGIIYTNSKLESEEIMKRLMGRGINLGLYRGEQNPSFLSDFHSKWLNGKYRVVVTHIALGIDKLDVRFVIHYNLPKSLDNYYEESGSAGRDNKPADCILFYRLSDVFKLSTKVHSQRTGLGNLYEILAYCLNSKMCRRSIIISHFGEAWNSADCNSMCDHCQRPCESKEVDIGNYCQSLYEILQNAAGADMKLTGEMLIDAWIGKGIHHPRVNTFPVSNLDPDMCENIVGHLLIEGYLQEDFRSTPYSKESCIIRGPRAGMLSNGEHKITMEIKGKYQPFSDLHNTKEYEETLENQCVERKWKDSKDVILDTPNKISFEKSNKLDERGSSSYVGQSGGHTQYNVRKEPYDIKPSQSGTEYVGDYNSAPNIEYTRKYSAKKKSTKRTADEVNLCSGSSYEEPVYNRRKYF